MTFFELKHQDKKTAARAGVLHTDHGDIETPCFMPVGTQATVKTLDQTDLTNIGAPIILGNTYHLHLRPGEDLIAEQGGLHKFMNWNKPILTDSGGFQVFSLGLQKNKKTKNQENKNTVIPSELAAASDEESLSQLSNGQRSFPASSAGQDDKTQGRLVDIDEDGVTFRSHLDGSTHRFTPESAIQTQHKIGADIIMAFDECTPDGMDEKYTREAMERTHRWAKRCLEYHKNNSNKKDYRQFLFGIIQGSDHRKLREESTKFISSLDFDGIALGGESVGYNMKVTADILDWTVPLMPADKPRYTMGLGLSPSDMLIAVAHGADMFDCVAPTRIARHGMLFTFDPKNKHRLNIKNAKYARDTESIDDSCDCPTCKKYTRSYLHHLFNADEISGLRLASLHNTRFMLKLMEEARTAILEDRFDKLLAKWI